jgi:hypothetical protein
LGKGSEIRQRAEGRFLSVSQKPASREEKPLDLRWFFCYPKGEMVDL